MEPFTTKYRPVSTSDIQGHTQAIERVLDFVRNYKSQKKKGMLIHGAPGSGKTSMVHAIAAELGLEIVEVNASDHRNKDSIESIIGNAIKQQSLFGAGKIILFDEVDGLSGNKDRGGISAVVDLMKKSSFPVLLTANDPWDSKFSTLRSNCELVELRTLAYTSVLSVLKKICESEDIMFEEDALKSLARRAGGDLRGALTDLQTLGNDKLIDNNDLEDLGERRKKENMFNAMMRILKGSDPKMSREIMNSIDENPDEVFMWVDENLPREYTRADDLEAAYDALSKADVYRGRIRRWQYWRFLVYVIDLMTAGVSLAKEEKYKGFTKYQRTQRLLKYWRANQANAKRDAIASKIAVKTHISTRVARDQLPFFKQVIKKDKKHPFVDYFELEKEEVDWLTKK